MLTAHDIIERVRAERDPKQAAILLVQSLAAMVRDEVASKISEILDGNTEHFAQAIVDSPDGEYTPPPAQQPTQQQTRAAQPQPRQQDEDQAQQGRQDRTTSANARG